MLFQPSQTDYTELLKCQLQSQVGQPVTANLVRHNIHHDDFSLMNSLMFICHVQTRLSVLIAFAVLKSAVAYHIHTDIMIIYIFLCMWIISSI